MQPFHGKHTKRYRRPPFLGLLLLLALTVFGLGACSSAAPQAPTQTPIPSATVPPTQTPLPTSTLAPTAIPYTSPDWFDNAVLYAIFVRSFADADGDGIGDLQGITDKLDYLDDLGVDALWLLPIYPSPSYHGYDVTDFFAVNPDYGTLEDLQTLVEAAHQRDIRILLDFVPSHLSNQNPIFQQAYKHPGAANEDWFVFTNENNTFYAGFADSEEMPRFNHYNPEVVDYLTEAALFWLDLDGDGDYSDGVDGFRIDNATFPPQEFFFQFRQSIKAQDPDALLLGETWVTDIRSMSIFFEDQFDALFDFPLYSIAQGNQNFNLDGLLAGKISPVLLTALLQEEAERYPPEALAVRFFSNHDTNRIATELGGDLARQKLAATLLASLPGPMLIYYGEEIGMLGQKGGTPWWDAYRREPMDWYAAEEGVEQATWFKPDDRWNAPNDGISVEEESANPDSLLNHYRAMLALRMAHSALQTGEISFPASQGSAAGGWVMSRSGGAETIVAIFNFGTEENTLTISAMPFSADAPTDLIGGEVFPATQEGQPYSLTLPPAGAILLTP